MSVTPAEMAAPPARMSDLFDTIAATVVAALSPAWERAMATPKKLAEAVAVPLSCTDCFALLRYASL